MYGVFLWSGKTLVEIGLVFSNGERVRYIVDGLTLNVQYVNDGPTTMFVGHTEYLDGEFVRFTKCDAPCLLPHKALLTLRLDAA